MIAGTPPHEPAPLAIESSCHRFRLRRWMWAVVLLLMVILTAQLVVFPGDNRHSGDGRQEIVSNIKRGLLAVIRSLGDGRGDGRPGVVINIKQIGLALFSFDQDYGKYPNAGTIATVRQKTGTLLPLGTKTSNDYLRQLIAAGVIGGGKSFYARIQGSRKPDDLIDGTHALEKGECGFSYIIGPNSSGHPPQPLLVTPLLPGTDRFDPKPFDGKAVIFWTDNGATMEIINKTGHVTDRSGNNLLDPANPIWAGKPPLIAWPE